MYRYATINGVTRYPEHWFDSTLEFESFAEYWDATIKTEYNGKIILITSYQTILL